VALHVGNFVGVSLAYLTAVITARKPDALVLSVDPNLCHRGIANPQSHVTALLSACGLSRNSIVLAAYSGAKSISNDGVVFESYNPEAEFQNETSCEMALANLSKICPGVVDVAMLDGNHEACYLIEELKQLRPLLKGGALLILDDVNQAWAEIQAVFEDVAALGFTAIATDGRVGIARYTSIPQ
jgi:hypothetical protein